MVTLAETKTDVPSRNLLRNASYDVSWLRTEATGHVTHRIRFSDNELKTDSVWSKYMKKSRGCSPRIYPDSVLQITWITSTNTGATEALCDIKIESTKVLKILINLLRLE